MRLAVADNIRSLLALCSKSRTISNPQFHFNYLFLSVCNTIEGKDELVAQGRRNKKNVSAFSGPITTRDPGGSFWR